MEKIKTYYFYFLIFALIAHLYSQDSVLHFEGKQPIIESEAEYWQIVEFANQGNFRNLIEADFLLFLTPSQKEQYQKLSKLTERKQFIRDYWTINNPDPLMKENDQLLNYLQRRKYSIQNFSTDTPPYYDDRGKYYIKYGAPVFRYQDSGGPQMIEGPVSIIFRRYSTIPNESWSYTNVAPNFVVHFIKKKDKFVEINDLSKVILYSHRQGRRVWYMSDILQKRFWLSSLINEAVTEIRAIETQIFINNRGVPGQLDEQQLIQNRINQKIFNNIQDMEYKLQEAKRDVPVRTYKPVNAQSELPFFADISQFRGQPGKTKMQINISTPLKELINISDAQISQPVQILFSSLLQNVNYKKLDSDSSYKSTQSFKAGTQKQLQFVDLLQMEVRPQPIILTLHIEDKINQKIGFVQRDFTIRNFDTDSLMISDLQLYREIDKDQKHSIYPLIDIQDHLLTLPPGLKIEQTQTLFCYFELYNLLGSENTKEYEITFKIVEESKDNNILKWISESIKNSEQQFISITNSYTATQNVSQELMQFNLKDLHPARYQLIVIVENSQNPTNQVLAHKSFTLSGQ